MSEPVGACCASILHKAHTLRRYLRHVRLATGLFAIGLVGACLAAVVPVFALVDAPWWLRVGCLGAGIVALISGAGLTAWWVRATPSLDRIAVLAEKRFPDLEDRFVTAVELGLDPIKGGRPAVAVPLLERLAQQAEKAVQGVDLRQAVDTRTLRRLGTAFAAMICVLVPTAVLFPSLWAAAFRAPNSLPSIKPPSRRVFADVRPLTGPSIVDLSLRLEPPAYTGLRPENRSEDFESLSTPVGTRVTIIASVRGQGALSAELWVDGLTQGARLGVPFVLTRSITWQVRARDRYGRTMETPKYRLRAVPDRAPLVSLTEPGKDVSLTQLAPIRLAYSAQDDWGLTALNLEYRLSEDERWNRVPFPKPQGRAAADAWNWDLRPLRLAYGQAIAYRLAATDNDLVTGPKTSRTPTYIARIGRQPTDSSGQSSLAMEEAAQRETRELESLEREAQELGKQLEELIVSLEKGDLTEAEQARRAAELTEAQRRVAEQADRLSRALSESEREAEREKLAPEFQEKLREIHDLLQQSMNQDLTDALKEIQRALQVDDRREFQAALQKARASQQEFAERVRQVFELLKRARMERSLSHIGADAERLARDQEKLNRQREKLSQGPSREARAQAEQQEELGKREKGLENELAALVGEASQLDKPLAERLREVNQRFQQSDVGKKMRQAAEMLRQGNPEAAKQPQETALEDLRQVAQNLRDIVGEMNAALPHEMSRVAQELTRDALYLSREQERVMRLTERMETFTAESASRGKAQRERVRRDQETLESSTRRLGSRLEELAKRTPALDPSLARKADEVAAQMSRAAREAAAGAGPQAVQSQRQAMRGITELAGELIRASEQMQQAASAAAAQGLLQQLQGLSQQQRAVNQQTEQMQGPERTPQSRSQGQLADDQQRIREALEQLLERSGQGSQLSQRLGDVPDDMRDVEQQLRENRLTTRTLMRQREILHRMLDAQRSVYQKEQQRRQRVAERPKPFRIPPSPPELTPRRPPPRPSIISDGELDLPLDFEDVVRHYFRALAELR